MTLFFTSHLSAPLITLPPEESKHCVKVLRMAPGEEVYLTDGCGTLCRCRILVADAKACELEVVQRLENYGQRPHRLHIAVAPTKNNARLEWFVEKAVEIGIDEITPLLCDHSERTSLHLERLDKIVVAAMKQSLKAYKPLLHEPTRMVDLVAQASLRPQARFICHCEGNERATLHNMYDGHSDALVLIGPEGDFSPREINAALQQGFQPITLGPSRLRTETAALYATVALNFMMDK